MEVVLPWGSAYGIARTLLAVGLALTLTFSSTESLFPPGVGLPDTPKCEGIGQYGLFCISIGVPLDALRIIGAVCLFVVASGWRPRITAFPHAYITWSAYNAITVPEGGDQIASILSVLLLPVALSDPRKWHWFRLDTDPIPRACPSGRPGSRISTHRIAVSIVALTFAKLQVAGLYFQAGIAKLNEREWLDGTSFYYWYNHDIFGAPQWMYPIFAPIVESDPGVAFLTWSPIILELALATSLLTSLRIRRFLLPAGLALHLGIAVTMGLWSFFCAMAAALILLTVPVGASLRSFYGIQWPERRDEDSGAGKHQMERV
ncbi:sporulation-delaying protein SdpB family protein [Nocardiopsis halophila]|uniref:sporulation-delaying protein SdpB family protein n=1 Tax=Nocardiopsis halophila TaxID=141692 RepID=UPI001378F754